MTFSSFNFCDDLNKVLKEKEYEVPTPIQKEAILPILAGKDLLGLSQTGTGKTAAFLLPILQKLCGLGECLKEVRVGFPRVVILVPTRELASQIGEEVEEFSKYMDIESLVLYGGKIINSNEEKLKERVDILVTTPNKLLHLIGIGLIFLDDVEFFVLDEADKLIQIGLETELKMISRKLPRSKQSLFFSATMSKEIKSLASELLSESVIVEIPDEEWDVKLISQHILYVQPENKEKLLLEILRKKEVKSAIIFTNSRNVADDLVRLLTANNIKSEALHSNKSNTHRTKVVNNIKSRKIKYLISTDLASRGLDVDNITHVINYEMPKNADDYTHKIGRTGRCGNRGVAFTICLRSDKSTFIKIKKLTGFKIETHRHSFHSELVRNDSGKKGHSRNKVKKNGRNKKYAGKRGSGVGVGKGKKVQKYRNRF